MDPTGLDSTSALLIIRALKSLTTPTDASLRPTTVILTIHQPSSQIFHHFDQVILLGMGGVQMYAGNAADSRGWFAARGYECPEGWNPADCESSLRVQPPFHLARLMLLWETIDFLDLATSPPRDLVPGPPLPTASHSRSTSSASVKETSTPPSNAFPTVPSNQARSKTTAVSKPLSLKNRFQLDNEDRKPSTVTLTQFEALAMREGKNLKRDWSLFVSLRFTNSPPIIDTDPHRCSVHAQLCRNHRWCHRRRDVLSSRLEYRRFVSSLYFRLPFSRILIYRLAQVSNLVSDRSFSLDVSSPLVPFQHSPISLTFDRSFFVNEQGPTTPLSPGSQVESYSTLCLSG